MTLLSHIRLMDKHLKHWINHKDQAVLSLHTLAESQVAGGTTVAGILTSTMIMELHWAWYSLVGLAGSTHHQWKWKSVTSVAKHNWERRTAMYVIDFFFAVSNMCSCYSVIQYKGSQKCVSYSYTVCFYCK